MKAVDTTIFVDKLLSVSYSINTFHNRNLIMKMVSFLLLSFFLLSAFSVHSAEIQLINVQKPDVSGFVGYVPDEIVVKFDLSVTSLMD